MYQKIFEWNWYKLQLLHLTILISFIAYSVPVNSNLIRPKRHLGVFYKNLQPIIENPFISEPIIDSKSPIVTPDDSTLQDKLVDDGLLVRSMIPNISPDTNPDDDISQQQLLEDITPTFDDFSQKIIPSDENQIKSIKKRLSTTTKLPPGFIKLPGEIVSLPPTNLNDQTTKDSSSTTTTAPSSSEVKPSLVSVPEQSKGDSTVLEMNETSTELPEPEHNNSTTQPELENPTALPEVKSSTAQPELENPTVLPEVKSSTAQPELENPTVLPKVKSSTAQPELENPTVLPEFKNSTVLPELKKPTVLPEVKSSTALPELENLTVSPKVKTSTALPELKNPTVLPDVKKPTLLPELENPTGLPEVKSSSPLPELENPTALPEAKDPVVSLEPESPTILPEIKNSIALPEIKNPTVLPEGKDAISSPDPESSTVLPEVKSSTALPELKNPTVLPEGKDTILSPKPESSTILPEVKSSTALPELKNPTALPEGKDTILSPKPESSTILPELKSSTALPELKNPTALPEGKDTILSPEPESSTILPEVKSSTALPELKNPTVLPEDSIASPDPKNPAVLPEVTNSTVLPDLANSTLLPALETSSQTLPNEDSTLPARKKVLGIQTSSEGAPEFSAVETTTPGVIKQPEEKTSSELQGITTPIPIIRKPKSNTLESDSTEISPFDSTENPLATNPNAENNVVTPSSQNLPQPTQTIQTNLPNMCPSEASPPIPVSMNSNPDTLIVPRTGQKPSEPTTEPGISTTTTGPTQSSVESSDPKHDDNLALIAQLLEKLNKQKEVLDNQIAESKKALDSITKVLNNDRNRKVNDVINRAQEEEFKPLANELKENTTEYDKVLDPVAISNANQTQRAEAKQWIISRITIPMHFQLMQSYLGLKMVAPNCNFNQRLHVINLFSEAHVDCIRNRQYQLRSPLEAMIIKLSCITKSTDPGKISNNWQPNNYLNRGTIEQIRDCGQPDIFYSTNPFGRNTIIFRRIQDNYQDGLGSFENIQRRFIQQVKLANQGVEEMRQQCIRQQQLQMESEQVPHLSNAYLPKTRLQMESEQISQLSNTYLPKTRRNQPEFISSSMGGRPVVHWVAGQWKPSPVGYNYQRQQFS